MSKSNLKSLPSMLAVPLRMVAFAALVLFLMQAGKAQAFGGTFNPTATVTLSDYNACATADITSVFDVPKGDMNFQTDVTLTPEQWGQPDPNLPIGAIVGQLSSISSLGLMGGPCNQSLNVSFTLYNATVDTSDELARAAPPKEPQEAVVDPDPSVTYPRPGVEHYPVWLKDPKVFGSLQPIARYIGLNLTAAPPTKIVLQFVIFAPGTCLPNAPCPAPAGYPAVVVLQDPTTVAPSAITDFCTRMHSSTVYYGLSQDNPATAANEAGYVLRRNPIQAGTYTFLHYARSYYNADNDPYENYLDTCPICTGGLSNCINNEDPTASAGSDLDGFDSVCDPDPTHRSPAALMTCGAGSGLPDYDQDCYPDTGDNCPAVANGIKADGTIIGANNQRDTDSDYIGDACDPNPSTPDGATLNTLPDNLPIPIEITEVADCDGDGMPNTYELANACLDPVVDDANADADSDGVSNIDEMNAGTDPCVASGGGGTPTATGTPTGSPTPGTSTAVAGSPTALATPTPTAEGETCSPVFPGTFNGRVLINGTPAASGYQLTASIGDVQWGSTTISGGRYAMDIPDHMPTAKPCFEGGTIKFQLNDMACTPAEKDADVWHAGIRNVDLNCAPVAPPVTPTPTTAPPATPTPKATPPGATPTPVPTKMPPTGAGGLAGSSSGLPLWAMALASWAGLMIVSGLGTLMAAKRR